MPDDTHVVIPEHITTKETDRRGRLTLGKEYADRRVTVAVIKSEPVASQSDSISERGGNDGD